MSKQEPKQYFMYVVRCSDGTLYTGYTDDVERRVACHNEGKGAKYTRSRTPVKLIASAQFRNKHDALSAEYHFKGLSREKKEALLQQSATTPLEDLLLQLIKPR